jgi:multiple sugar transport system permease protein
MLELRGSQRLIGHACLLTAIVLIVGPLVWTFLNALKYQIDILTGAFWFTPTIENLHEVLLGRRSDFLANVVNSLIVAGTSTALVLVIGTLAAFALARLSVAPWISRLLLGWTVLFHAIHAMTLVGPWYLLFRETGLYDTLTALMLTHTAMNLPIVIWLMMAYFRDVPREIEEAAYIDGCRRSQVLARVLLPLVVPGLITAGVLSFVFSWNEFAIALNLTSRQTATVPVAMPAGMRLNQVRSSVRVDHPSTRRCRQRRKPWDL